MTSEAETARIPTSERTRAPAMGQPERTQSLYMYQLPHPMEDGQWVALITGRDTKYRFARTFKCGFRDYRHARRTMRGALRDVRVLYPLRVGQTYELCVSERPGKRRHLKLRRWFGYVAEGGLVEIERAEVERVLDVAKPARRGLGIDVLAAAQQRIKWVFDTFSRIYLSGPSGKDSSAMMHLACMEARRRGRTMGVLYVDLEAQYQRTIKHVEEMYDRYADVVDPHWVALPLRLRNAVSMEQPYWVTWDPEARDSWVRAQPTRAVTDPAAYPFYRPPAPQVDGEAREAMEFEEFVEQFGQWYSDGQACACLVGIRTDESLNRWRAIVKKRKSRLDGKGWTSWKGGQLFNAYPIYDWKTADVWTYFGSQRLPYNDLYDQMYRAGLSIHQQRICQPFGDDQRRSLNMYHVIEPETWGRVVARVSGANSGALYAGKRGNILGNGKVECPPGHTWRSFARLLLDSLPEFERSHYEDKIAMFLRWYQERGFPAGIPDEADPKDEAQRKAPSWRRVCKVILKNDRMCRGLGFSQHVSGTYRRYRKLMEKRRSEWGLQEIT